MSHEQIMIWAEQRHFPFLELADGETLRHGREHYEQLRHSPRRLTLAASRIQLWNEVAAGVVLREAVEV